MTGSREQGSGNSETLIVTGFGRCGSTLLMTMLHAGGMPVHADSLASFEADEFRHPGSGMDWSRYAGKAIKVLDPQRWAFPSDAKIRFIFVQRDAKEQAKSWAKFLAATSRIRTSREQRRAVERSYAKDLPLAKEAIGSHPVLFVRFERILSKPWEEADRIAGFVGGGLDLAAMGRVVIRRPGKCAAGLQIELDRVMMEDRAA